jgi:hypothetical protein
MLKAISRNLVANRFNLVRRIATKMAKDRIVWMDMEMTGKFFVFIETFNFSRKNLQFLQVWKSINAEFYKLVSITA